MAVVVQGRKGHWLKDERKWEKGKQSECIVYNIKWVKKDWVNRENRN